MPLDSHLYFFINRFEKKKKNKPPGTISPGRTMCGRSSGSQCGVNFEIDVSAKQSRQVLAYSPLFLIMRHHLEKSGAVLYFRCRSSSASKQLNVTVQKGFFFF